MKILIVVSGSFGDLTPFIQIANRLKHKHEIIFAIPEDVEHQMEKYDFTYHCYMKLAPDNAENYHNFVFNIIKRQHSDAFDYFDEVNKLCDGVSLILRNPHAGLGLLVAEYNNIPCVDIFLSPVFFKHNDLDASRLNSWFLPKTNETREKLNLPLAENIPLLVFKHDNLKIAGYPDFYVDKLKDNPELAHTFNHPNFRFSNFPPLMHELELSEETEKFLAQGEPPVCFDLGTGGTVMSNPKDLWEIAYRLGTNVKRMIILHEQGNFPDHPDIHFLPGIVPHHKLFPRCSLVINHGGLGTIGKCLWSNVPQVCVPQMIENELCARLMDDMITAIHPSDVTYEKLKSLILNPNYNYDLGKIRGDYIRQNDGVEMIINILKEYKYLDE
jgi:UDP:flavonoid glycosyltransferase YjiC (YdhE family)